MKLKIVLLFIFVFVLNTYADIIRDVELYPGYNSLVPRNFKYFGQEFLNVDGKKIPIYEGDITKTQIKLSLLAAASAFSSNNIEAILRNINNIDKKRKDIDDALNETKDVISPSAWLANFIVYVVSSASDTEKSTALGNALKNLFQSNIALANSGLSNPNLSKAKAATIIIKYFYDITIKIIYGINIDINSKTKEFKKEHWLLDWLITNGITTCVDLAWAYKEKNNLTFPQAWNDVGGLANLQMAINTVLDAFRLINLASAYIKTNDENSLMDTAKYIHKFIYDYVNEYDLNILKMWKYVHEQKPKWDIEYFHQLFFAYIHLKYGYSFSDYLPTDILKKKMFFSYLTLEIIRRYGNGGNFRLVAKISNNNLVDLQLKRFSNFYWMPPIDSNDKILNNKWNECLSYLGDIGNIDENIIKNLGSLGSSKQFLCNSYMDYFPAIDLAQVDDNGKTNIAYKSDIVEKNGSKYLYLHNIVITINYNSMLFKRDTKYQIYPKGIMKINGILIPLYNNIRRVINNVKDKDLRAGLNFLYQDFALPTNLTVNYKKWLYSPVTTGNLVNFTKSFRCKLPYLIGSGKTSTCIGYVKNTFLAEGDSDPTIRKYYYKILLKLFKNELSDESKRVLSKDDLLALKNLGISNMYDILNNEKNEKKRDEILNGHITNAEAIILSYRLYKKLKEIKNENSN